MIDLHVHLLPDWDDGPKTFEDAQAMANIARSDGIQKIGVTPHIFRVNTYDGDWEVLNDRVTWFRKLTGEFPCKIFFGAEVFIQPSITASLRPRHLTINESDYFFLEFSPETLFPGVKEYLYNVMLEGFVPIISHPERNAEFQARPQLLYELITMNCLAQVTAKSILGGFGPEAKHAADIFLSHNLVHVIASDAHDCRERPPRLRWAVEEAAKIIGDDKAEAMVTSIPQAILDNQGIEDWGEAKDPGKSRKTWVFHLPWKK